MSARRSSPRSISASLMVVYSYGSGVVPKVGLRKKKASVPTIAMRVTAICAFLWTRRYASSRSVFPIRMCIEVHFMHMATIVWSILRRQNP